MKPFTEVAALCIAGVVLAGCGTQLERAQGQSPQGTAFDKNLYEGYIELAKGEFGEGDYQDSDTFARRAMTAGSGDQIGPEKIEARGLPGDKVAELAESRQRLVSALAAGASDKQSAEAARAQVMFDCWMQEQEENNQPEDIAACRAEFLTAMAKLDDQPQQAAAPAPAPAPAAAPGPWIVNFEFDKAELTSDARAVLTEVARTAKSSSFQAINVTGFTDLVGDETYNKKLSEARTQAVVDFLVQSGLAKGKIVGASFGKDRPVVDTVAPERRNRRVEIKLAQ